jgi:hypothetical protein
VRVEPVSLDEHDRREVGWRTDPRQQLLVLLLCPEFHVPVRVVIGHKVDEAVAQVANTIEE